MVKIKALLAKLTACVALLVNWKSTTVYQARIDNNSVAWVQIGRLVIVGGTFRAITTHTGQVAIATGLPLSGHNAESPIPCCVADGSVQNNAFLSRYGTLCMNGMTNGKWYTVGGVYWTSNMGGGIALTPVISTAIHFLERGWRYA